MLLDEFDSLFQGKGNNLATDNPSKYLLYQDVMLGMFDYHLQGVDTQSYYGNLAKKLEEALPTVEKYHSLFEFYHALALVLADKANLGIRLKKAYDSKDLIHHGRNFRESYPQTSGKSPDYAHGERRTVDERCETFWI